MSTHRITARSWEHGWELFEGEDILTQCATLVQAAQQAQDALATERGGEPEDYTIDLAVDLDGLEAEVRAARARLHSAQSDLVEVSQRWRALAASLRQERHLSVRDTAVVMGISPGRVNQLVGTR